MPQRWIDNWSTTTAVAIASEEVVPLADLITGDPLDRLNDLLGNSADNWCELTLDDGEGGIEVIKVDGTGTIVRAWTTDDGLPWPLGSTISARLTAKAMHALQAATTLSRANLVAKLEGGHAGMDHALFWADADLGAYARYDFGRSFGWAAIDTNFETTDSWVAYEGYAKASGSGVGAEITTFSGVSGLYPGSTSTGSCTLEVGPAPAAVYAPQPVFALATDPIAEIDARLVLRLGTAANDTNDFNLEWALSIPCLGVITFRQSRAVNSGNLTITYNNAGDVETTINTSVKLANFDRAYCVNVVPSGDDYAVEIAYRTNIASDTGKVVLANLLASAMVSAQAQFGYTAKITKLAGTTSIGVQVKRFVAKLTLQ
ncbi:hypothetical protein M2318_004838 [Metapseudomonas resinovorans]|uniref:hypothetical protein n=1 Tax=Metapseudomonas resinovorans TaxID=53412 RepID=UPI003D21BFF0